MITVNNLLNLYSFLNPLKIAGKPRIYKGLQYFFGHEKLRINQLNKKRLVTN